MMEVAVLTPKITKYFISAVPNAKNDSVEVIGPNILRVRIAAKPVDGEANQRLIKVLAEYFNVAKSSVRLKAGSTFRQKIVEISADQPES